MVKHGRGKLQLLKLATVRLVPAALHVSCTFEYKSLFKANPNLTSDFLFYSPPAASTSRRGEERVDQESLWSIFDFSTPCENLHLSSSTLLDAGSRRRLAVSAFCKLYLPMLLGVPRPSWMAPQWTTIVASTTINSFRSAWRHYLYLL